MQPRGRSSVDERYLKGPRANRLRRHRPLRPQQHLLPLGGLGRGGRRRRGPAADVSNYQICHAIWVSGAEFLGVPFVSGSQAILNIRAWPRAGQTKQCSWALLCRAAMGVAQGHASSLIAPHVLSICQVRLRLFALGALPLCMFFLEFAKTCRVLARRGSVVDS